MDGKDAIDRVAALRIGTGGGTLLGLVCQLGVHDMLKTAILAALGALVSFLVTLLLQRFSQKR